MSLIDISAVKKKPARVVGKSGLVTTTVRYPQWCGKLIKTNEINFSRLVATLIEDFCVRLKEQNAQQAEQEKRVAAQLKESAKKAKPSKPNPAPKKSPGATIEVPTEQVQ